ncbi:adenylate cyclase type 3-like protein [Willisornis vidua]|uniref:Adenylate cyclase type 3-like protein n=1 Tax=Willisornis vidua TaxID=1566151 RepID=A0ABQ9DUF7_9PASS|nr:adenylate cyclase type 3-like protein [Willisornis vidua]
MPRNTGAFSEPEFSAEYSADHSVSLPWDPERGAPEVTLRRSGLCPCLPRSVRLSFSPESLENLYQTYFRRQRHETLPVLLVFAALFDCHILATGWQRVAPAVAAGTALVAHAGLLALCRWQGLPQRWWRRVLPCLLWVLVPAQVLCHLALGSGRAPEPPDTVGWQAFFAFSFFLTLPLRLAGIVGIAATSCALHTLVLGVAVAQQRPEGMEGTDIVRQVRGHRGRGLCPCLNGGPAAGLGLGLGGGAGVGWEQDTGMSPELHPHP